MVSPAMMIVGWSTFYSFSFSSWYITSSLDFRSRTHRIDQLQVGLCRISVYVSWTTVSHPHLMNKKINEPFKRCSHRIKSCYLVRSEAGCLGHYGCLVSEFFSSVFSAHRSWSLVAAGGIIETRTDGCTHTAGRPSSCQERTGKVLI